MSRVQQIGYGREDLEPLKMSLRSKLAVQEETYRAYAKLFKRFVDEKKLLESCLDKLTTKLIAVDPKLVQQSRYPENASFVYKKFLLAIFKVQKFFFNLFHKDELTVSLHDFKELTRAKAVNDEQIQELLALENRNKNEQQRIATIIHDILSQPAPEIRSVEYIAQEILDLESLLADLKTANAPHKEMLNTQLAEITRTLRHYAQEPRESDSLLRLRLDDERETLGLKLAEISENEVKIEAQIADLKEQKSRAALQGFVFYSRKLIKK